MRSIAVFAVVLSATIALASPTVISRDPGLTVFAYDTTNPFSVGSGSPNGGYTAYNRTHTAYYGDSSWNAVTPRMTTYYFQESDCGRERCNTNQDIESGLTAEERTERERGKITYFYQETSTCGTVFCGTDDVASSADIGKALAGLAAGLNSGLLWKKHIFYLSNGVYAFACKTKGMSGEDYQASMGCVSSACGSGLGALEWTGSSALQERIRATWYGAFAEGFRCSDA